MKIIYSTLILLQFAKESPERTEKVKKKPGFWDWMWSGGSDGEEGNCHHYIAFDRHYERKYNSLCSAV